jgi:hypothetical protein
MNEVTTEVYRTKRLPLILYGFSTWSFTSLSERQNTCGKKGTERKLGRVREDICSEWRKLDVAVLQNVRSSINVTERIFSATLSCTRIYSGTNAKTIHLLQIHKLLF